MPREVNVWTSDWRATGEKVQVPQYRFGIRVEWRTNKNVAKQHQRVALFPDDLLELVRDGDADDREWLEDRLRELLLDVQRRLAKVDKEDAVAEKPVKL